MELERIYVSKGFSVLEAAAITYNLGGGDGMEQEVLEVLASRGKGF